MIRPISILLIFFVTFTSATSFSLSDRPTLKYGTAWKKEATADLVFKAVIHGFRRQLFVMFDFFLAVLCLCDQYKYNLTLLCSYSIIADIDTACQPRHYNEAGVGEGWTKAVQALKLSREDIWLQTKYSSLDAQDPQNTPYDRNSPIENRVRKSLEVSLENLKTDYLDSWVMHGPENNWDDNFKVWDAMETAVDEGKVRQLGISNWYRLEDIQWLYDHARIKPKVKYCTFFS